MDFGLLGVSKRKDFERAVDQDRARYISQSGSLTQRGKKIIQDPSWKEDPALSDTFSAMTKNKIYGIFYHRTEYWEQGSEQEQIMRQRAEVVANAYDVWASGYKPLLQQYRNLFPALAVLFDNLFGTAYIIQ